MLYLNKEQFLSLINYSILEQEFEKIKQKVLKEEIVIKNLNNKRGKLEALIDSFVGYSFEFIISEHLKKEFINNGVLVIDYLEERKDNGVFPDIFDLIILNKEDKKCLLEIKKICEVSEEELTLDVYEFQAKKIVLLKELKNKYNFFIVEIKSSRIRNIDFNKINDLNKNLEFIEKQLNSLSFVQYASLKYPYLIKDKILRKKIEDFELVPIKEYFNYLYKKYDLNTLNLYLNKTNIYLKDIISNGFYETFKKEGIHNKNISDSELENLTLKDFFYYYPNYYFYDFYTTKEKLITLDDNIGKNNKKINAIYHDNKISDKNIELNELIKIIKEKLKPEEPSKIYDFGTR